MGAVRRRACSHEVGQRRPAIRAADVAERLPERDPEPPPATGVVDLERHLPAGSGRVQGVHRAPDEHLVLPAARVVRDDGLAVTADLERLGRAVAGDELGRLRGRGERRGQRPGDETGNDQREEAARRRRIRSAPAVTASRPEPRPDEDVERFLLLLAARRSPRTVDAYRRDLAALAGFLGQPAGDATREGIERWLASMRAAGLAPTTLSRRVSAVRSYFRHLTLIGVKGENPAAAIELPRRQQKLPRALSPAEMERLIDAAAGTTPRSLRDHALVELMYGAGLRVSEAVGLEKGAVDLDDRIVRVVGKGGKERLVPLGRLAAEAVRRYLALGRPHLDRRFRPELFLNARGGALTRAGAFLILRKLADRAGL